MKIIFTIKERVDTLKLFDAFKGSITELSTILDDVKKVAITQEEWDKAKRVITKTDQGEQWQWNEADEATWKDIDLGSESVAYLLKSIKDKSDKGEISIADATLLSIQKKLA